MHVDWGFWILFLLPLAMGLTAGWVMRGEYERDKAELRRVRRDMLMRELEQAKRRHPAYKQGYYEERLF